MLLRSSPKISVPEPSLLRAHAIVKQACSSAKAIFMRAARLRLKSHCVARRFGCFEPAGVFWVILLPAFFWKSLRARR